MAKIDELLQELCPDGVEFYPLWRVTAWDKKFNGVDKSMQEKIVKYKYLLAKDLENIIDVNGNVRILYTTTDVAFTTEEKAGEFISEGEIVAIPWGGNVSVKYYKGKFVTGDNRIATSLDTSVLDNKYLFFWMENNIDLLSSFYRGAGIKHPSMLSVLNLEIPIPHINIQHYIVETLDTFTDAISNLEEELALREKQFEYYRESILSFENESVDWTPISELGQIIRGNGLQKKDFVQEGVGCIHYGQIYTKFGLSTSYTLSFVDAKLADKLTKVDPGNLVIACTSENVDDLCKSVVWLGNTTIVTGGHACVLKHKENAKYIGYCFTSNSFQSQKKKFAYGTKVLDIKKDKLGEIKIPVPSLERQQEIVEILDTFEAMIANIKEEIALRTKQYEYYREKLLSFGK